MAIPSDAYILAAAMVLAAAAPFVLKIRPNEHLTPRAWIAVVYVVVFVFRPLYILHRPEEAHPYIASEPDFPRIVVTGMAVALVGLLAFWIGYSTGLGTSLGRVIPVFRRELSSRRWLEATFGLWFISVAAYAVLLRQMGGLPRLLSILYARAAFYEADEMAGPAHSVAQFAGVAASFGLYYHLVKRRTWWAWPLLLVASVLVGTMGGRGAVLIQIWLLSYVVYAFCKPRYRSWKLLVGMAAVVAVVATGAVMVRRATKLGGEAVIETVRALPADFAEELLNEARGFDYMASAMHATGRDITRLDGYSYIQVLPIMVPRMLWPYPTETAGVTLRAAIEPQGLGGRPPGAMGEGLMNFGQLGAIVAMFALGIYTRAVHTYMLRSLGRSPIAPLLCAYALVLMPKFLVGVGPFAVRTLVLRVVLILIAYAWAAKVANAKAKLSSTEADALSAGCAAAG